MREVTRYGEDISNIVHVFFKESLIRICKIGRLWIQCCQVGNIGFMAGLSIHLVLVHSCCSRWIRNTLPSENQFWPFGTRLSGGKTVVNHMNSDTFMYPVLWVKYVKPFVSISCKGAHICLEKNVNVKIIILRVIIVYLVWSRFRDLKGAYAAIFQANDFASLLRF